MVVRATLVGAWAALLFTGFVRGDAPPTPPFSDVLAENPKLNRWLTVQMPEVGGGPFKSYTASSFLTSQLLWQNGAQALYYATAHPPTWATREEIGVLIAARCGGDGKWHVMKSLRFEAIGKEGGTNVKLTSFDPLGQGHPVVTVTLDQGGRGYSYSESFTYTLEDDNFILHRPGGKNL
jgi:hypothetical protein